MPYNPYSQEEVRQIVAGAQRVAAGENISEVAAQLAHALGRPEQGVRLYLGRRLARITTRPRLRAPAAARAPLKMINRLTALSKEIDDLTAKRDSLNQAIDAKTREHTDLVDRLLISITPRSAPVRPSRPSHDEGQQ